MKSYPNAASRSAAEVVTQLPVPSRLGMLRYERLNEASWALLFLDPSCEQPFGVPAGDLCGLIDSPYASLMEPAARYQLHDDIQQQIALHPHYVVRYTLHTPNGSLSLLELGEPFKQHGRQLLRGYLLVMASDANAPQPTALVAALQTALAPALPVDAKPHLFQRAVEQSASAFVLVERSGRVEYVNPSFSMRCWAFLPALMSSYMPT